MFHFAGGLRTRRKNGSPMLSEYAENLGAAFMQRKTAIALRAAKVEAELASKTKSEFIANMSHELRTPLNAIIGFSEILVNPEDLSHEQIRQYSSHIREAATHLLDLINSILDVSKVQAGKLVIDPSETDLAEIIDSCRKIIMPKAREKELFIEWKISPDLPVIIADPMRLKQILINLLSNAVKFTPAGGRIQVRAWPSEDGKSVSLSVTDTGPGMTPEEIDIAMSPFGQVRSDLNKTHEGTGLGLPLSNALVRLHDGRLKIESRKGAGTRVLIELPVHGPRTAHAAAG